IAPTLSASAGNISVSAVADKALLLSIITGVIALTISYLMIRKTIQKPNVKLVKEWEKQDAEDEKDSPLPSKTQKKIGNIFALVIPISFAIVVLYMIMNKLQGSETADGGEGAALIGGVAFLLLIAASISGNW